MFENKAYKGIYYSRFIASWWREGGTPYVSDFEDWLRQLIFDEGEKMDENTINDIVRLFENGKLELEMNAKRFIKELKKV